MGASDGGGRVWLKAFIVWLVVIGGLFGAAELASRLFLGVITSPYEIMSLIHSKVGASSLNDALRYDDGRFWAVKEGVRDDRVVVDVFGRHLDFTINTDERGMRVMSDGKRARRKNGAANATEKPTMPMAGPMYSPCAALPIIPATNALVHVNEIRAKVNPIRKVELRPSPCDFLLRAFRMPTGTWIS